MEEDEPLTVKGVLMGVNGMVAFVSFTHPLTNQEERAMIRSNRIFINGNKLSLSLTKINKFETFYRENLHRVHANADVVPLLRPDAKFVTNEMVSIEPKFYAKCLWVGDEVPSTKERMGNSKRNSTSSDTTAQEEKEMRTKEGCTTVAGIGLGCNGTMAFMSFKHPANQNENCICAFRSTTMFVGGKKLAPSLCKQKKFEEHFKQHFLNSKLVADVEPHANSDARYTMTNTGEVVNPKYFSRCVWMGETEPHPSVRSAARKREDPGKTTKQQLDEPMDQSENIIEDEGTLVHVDLAGSAFISFSWHGNTTCGKVSLKHFHVNNEPVNLSELDACSDLKVNFIAEANAEMAEHVVILSEGTRTEKILKPEWTISLAWVGEKPERVMYPIRQHSFPDCEYACGRLVRLLDRQKGLLMTKNSNLVLFKIRNLVIDGKEVEPTDKLSDLLNLGEVLSCYTKPLTNVKSFGTDTCSLMAACIWKGKLISADDTKFELELSKLTNYGNLVSNAGGTVIEIDGDYGLAVQDSGGDHVLFSKHQLHVTGKSVSNRLHEMVQVGSKLQFDIAPYSGSQKFQWVAINAWCGTKPAYESEATKKEIFRAKIAKLDSRPGMGVVSGILHITNGSSNIGEKAFFTRQNMYIFGTCLEKADLSFVLKENDKLQVEIDPLDEVSASNLMLSHGVPIRFCARIAFIGPPPKPENLKESDPSGLCNQFINGIGPFLTKRGMDLEFFKRLVKGEIEPRTQPSLISETGNKFLSPAITVAKVVELKRPDKPNVGTSCGIVVIENGPYANERAFFERSVLWCFGRHMNNADLMHIIRQNELINVDIEMSGNKNVPFKVIQAWIGLHPSLKKSDGQGGSELNLWLDVHGISSAKELDAIASGTVPLKPFFPLPMEVQNARVAHLFSPRDGGKGGCEFGILKIYQGSLAKKDILFDRESVYLWDVHLKEVDLMRVLKISDRAFCEVAEIVGNKEKKKWQMRLNAEKIPRYYATLMFIGGGRPKNPCTISSAAESISNKTNLLQWLQKRGLTMEDLKPYNRDQRDRLHSDRVVHKADSVQFDSLLPNRMNSSNFRETDSLISRTVGSERTVKSINSETVCAENPIVTQAKNLLMRVMQCSSPEDSRVKEVITDDSEIQLATFISRTLENAVNVYKEERTMRQLSQALGNAPTRRSAQNGNGTLEPSGFRQRDGLHGLSKPLLDSLSVNGGGLSTNGFYYDHHNQRRPVRRGSPNDFQVIEPPIKKSSFF